MGIILMLLCEIFIFFRHLTWKCSYLIVIDMYDAKVLFCMQCVQKIWITVKLEIKELLNKEQTGFKELFSEYQLLYTINPLLNKELLPIYEMPILGISEHKIVKINKKGELFWPILGFYTKKESSKFVIHALHENFLEPNF